MAKQSMLRHHANFSKHIVGHGFRDPIGTPIGGANLATLLMSKKKPVFERLIFGKDADPALAANVLLSSMVGPATYAGAGVLGAREIIRMVKKEKKASVAMPLMAAFYEELEKIAISADAVLRAMAKRTQRIKSLEVAVSETKDPALKKVLEGNLRKLVARSGDQGKAIVGEIKRRNIDIASRGTAKSTAAAMEGEKALQRMKRITDMEVGGFRRGERLQYKHTPIGSTAPFQPDAGAWGAKPGYRRPVDPGATRTGMGFPEELRGMEGSAKNKAYWQNIRRVGSRPPPTWTGRTALTAPKQRFQREAGEVQRMRYTRTGHDAPPSPAQAKTWRGMPVRSRSATYQGAFSGYKAPAPSSEYLRKTQLLQNPAVSPRLMRKAASGFLREIEKISGLKSGIRQVGLETKGFPSRLKHIRTTVSPKDKALAQRLAALGGGDESAIARSLKVKRLTEAEVGAIRRAVDAFRGRPIRSLSKKSPFHDIRFD